MELRRNLWSSVEIYGEVLWNSIGTKAFHMTILCPSEKNIGISIRRLHKKIAYAARAMDP
jgi:hypothetical protein